MSTKTVTNLTTKVITGKVRFSYLHVFKPVAISEGQEPKYSVCLLIQKTDKETIKKINAAVAAAVTSGLTLWGGKTPAGLKLPLRDGDIDRPDQPEYSGVFFVNANSKTKPGVVDKQLNEILDSSEVYSGCFGRASINFYPFNQAGNKGIGCGLNNLQKTADGDYLGGRSRAEDDFETYEDDESYLT